MKINKKIQNVVLNRFLFSLGILTLIRFGTFLPVPGINHNDLAFYISKHSMTKNFLNTFSGNNTFVIGLFTLNIFPYINATIFTQLLLSLSPQLAKLQKEGDFVARRTIGRITRLITLILAIVQSFSISLYLKQILFNWNYNLGLDIVLWLTTGAMIVLWLSELITDYGLGNGSSLLISLNILCNLPNLYAKILNNDSLNSNITITGLCIIILFIFGSFFGIIFLQLGTRQIQLISAKQLNKNQIRIQNDNYYLPLRLNQAGVMPIVLTTTLLVIPNYIINLGFFSSLNFLSSFKFLYWIGYFGLILLSSFFYSTLVLKPKDLSDQLQEMAVIIPGIRPGLQTTFYLQQVIKRVTLIGATMLAIITIIPNFLESILNITQLNGLSTTSFLILVGVVLDLIREIENIYYSNIYKNI